MQGRDRDVCCVGGSLARYYAGGQDASRQFGNLRRDVQQRKRLQYYQPFPCSAGVSRTCFVYDELRDVDLKRVASLLPPFAGNLLVAGND